ncbi:MAG: hypothetical protein LBF71_05145 [Campylobacteraceae bacterium]|jgi:hypothetical protein|nr:hypothetical protein [Campylobacteraceae bacterium]
MRQGYYAEPKSELSLLVPILQSLQTQNETILKLLQEKPSAFSYIDKPSSRLSLRRLSNEEKFIVKVRDILRESEGLKQFELLSALGRRKDDRTVLRWLHGYDGIYWRANVVGAISPTYSYSLIEE